MEGKRAYWRRLDNAAKIFPATSNHRDTRVFRFYCELKDHVDGASLQQALDRTLEKYPVFLSVMRKGLFWFYMEKSDLRPIVKEEKDPPCLNLYIRDRKSLLFQVNYYKNRINLEVYHALTDGTGAMQFLKELVKNYLIIHYKDETLPDIPFTPEDVTMQDLENDSFSKYYVKPEKHLPKAPQRRPCRITGSRADYGDLNITEGLVSSSALLKTAKEHGVTITVFLTAVFLCAIHEEMSQSQRRKDVVLMVPVNLRKFFSSSSLLNFFGWIEPGYHFTEKSYNFSDILQTVKKYFEEELTAEKVRKHMGLFMKLERNPLLRLAPLELKNPVMQLANRLAQKDMTAILSNLGVVSMPPEYAIHLQRFGAFISTPKMQLTICSFQDDLVLSFSSAFTEHNIERNFFRILKSYGIESEIMQDRFPDRTAFRPQGSRLYQWFTFSCIAAAVISVVINVSFTPTLYWSVIAAGGILSMWTSLTIGFFKRHNLLKNGLWQLVIISAACILWDRFTGWQGWSLDFAYPAVCLAVLIFFQIVVRLQKLTVTDYMIYFILAGLFGLVPALLTALGLVHILYPSAICAGISFLFLVGLLIFKGRDMFAELYKKLHF